MTSLRIPPPFAIPLPLGTPMSTRTIQKRQLGEGKRKSELWLKRGGGSTRPGKGLLAKKPFSTLAGVDVDVGVANGNAFFQKWLRRPRQRALPRVLTSTSISRSSRDVMNSEEHLTSLRSKGVLTQELERLLRARLAVCVALALTPTSLHQGRRRMHGLG